MFAMLMGLKSIAPRAGWVGAGLPVESGEQALRV